MNGADLRTLAQEYSFIEAGEIRCQNDRFAFDLGTESSDQGFVYLWVEVSGQSYTVVYVGKAGKTLRARCNQHLGGFHGGSTAGLENARLLRQGIGKGNRYLLYSRKSPLMQLCGEDNIPSECIEELAFIKKFKQTLWNRA